MLELGNCLFIRFVLFKVSSSCSPVNFLFFIVFCYSNGVVPKEMENCSKCSKSMEGSQTYAVPGIGKYHRACFVCVKCNNKLAGQTFLQVDDGFSCQKCFSCDGCAKPITPGDQHLIIGGFKYHNKCLVCGFEGCHRPLTSKKFWKLGNGKPSCENHNGQ